MQLSCEQATSSSHPSIHPASQPASHSFIHTAIHPFQQLKNARKCLQLLLMLFTRNTCYDQAGFWIFYFYLQLQKKTGNEFVLWIVAVAGWRTHTHTHIIPLSVFEFKYCLILSLCLKSFDFVKLLLMHYAFPLMDGMAMCDYFHYSASIVVKAC